MTYPCPVCGAMASADTGCPSCGRAPDADAIEVIRTDAEITELIGQLAAARAVVGDLEARIGRAWQSRNAAAARVRAATGRPDQPETSARTVQNLLFVLGGLLLGVAAIVFTAVAWAQFGVGGRAALLGLGTAVALAVPLLALRRGLTATAETVAAVGLLLTLLDGYAARRAGLFGLAATDPARYAGVVFLLTAVLAAGYAATTRLTGPRYVALLAAQPVLLLLILPSNPGQAVWTVIFGLLAAADLAARRVRLAVFGFVLAGLAVAAALVPAVIAAGRTIEAATPSLHASWSALVHPAGWGLPPALLLVTAALFLTVPAGLRPAVPFAGAAAIALALPAALHAPWWTGPIADLVVVAGCLAVAVRRATPVALIVTALLTAHAVITGFGQPGTAAAVLTAVALLGIGTSVTAGHRGLALAGRYAGLVAFPAIAWTGTLALGLSGEWQARAVVAAFALILVGASTRASTQATVVAVAAGWGVALVAPAAGGTVLEAYTLPIAGLALAAALITRRDRTPSWMIFGPALNLALLPSLVLVLDHDGEYLRRLLLGLGALAILLVGVRLRLQAPVVAGAGTLAVVALHELTEIWDLIPRWIPLAAAGIVLVLLAATLEHRRRDLARVRQAVGRMT